MSLLNWQEEMKAMGFIMLPMVWRSGACVAMDATTIGCLVPPDEQEDLVCDGNFCVYECSYRALVRFGVKESVPVMQMLQTLLAIGERLYLRLESRSAAIVLHRLTVDIHVNELAQHALQVHLSAPNVLHPEKGKVFVACLVCKMNGGMRSIRGASSEILVVDPWELLMQPGERRVFKFMGA